MQNQGSSSKQNKRKTPGEAPGETLSSSTRVDAPSKSKKPRRARGERPAEGPVYHPGVPVEYTTAFPMKPSEPESTLPLENQPFYFTYDLESGEALPESGTQSQATVLGDSIQPQDLRRSGRIAGRSVSAAPIGTDAEEQTSPDLPSVPLLPAPGTIPDIFRQSPTPPQRGFTSHQDAATVMDRTGAPFAFNATPGFSSPTRMQYSGEPSASPSSNPALLLQGMNMQMNRNAHCLDSSFGATVAQHPNFMPPGHRASASMPSNYPPGLISSYSRSRMTASSGQPSPLRNAIPLQPQSPFAGSPMHVQQFDQNALGVSSLPAIAGHSFSNFQIPQAPIMHPYPPVSYPAAEPQQQQLPQGGLLAGHAMHLFQGQGHRHGMPPPPIMVPSPSQQLMDLPSPPLSISPGSGSGSASFSSGPGSANSSSPYASASQMHLLPQDQGHWHTSSPRLRTITSEGPSPFQLHLMGSSPRPSTSQNSPSGSGSLSSGPGSANSSPFVPSSDLFLEMQPALGGQNVGWPACASTSGAAPVASGSGSRMGGPDDLIAPSYPQDLQAVVDEYNQTFDFDEYHARPAYLEALEQALSNYTHNGLTGAGDAAFNNVHQQ